MSNVKVGITVGDSIKNHFTSAGSSGVRFIKVQLSEDCETLVDVGSKHSNGTWEEDFSLVPDELEDRQPCFILYRTDKTDAEGKFLWYTLCYVPDLAPVRQKMLYAGTKHTLKAELGPPYFIDEVHGTEKKEFSPAGFQEYLRHVASEAPLTASELLRIEERALGVAECAGGVSYSHGISFPVDDAVWAAFDEMTGGSINYIQLTIDIDGEIIRVAKSGLFTPEQVQEAVPLADCAFHYFNWSHEHEGQQQTSMVFAFSCPDGSGGTRSAPVKQRMLYASSKANAFAIPTSKGFELACKLDIGSGQDLSVNDYSVVIHPPVGEEKKTFKKPAAPRGRRMVGK